MRSRKYLVMEALKEKRVIVKYIHTSEMLADGLTKPIDGKDFNFFVDKLMG
jgi:hypothetical protein